MTMKIRDIPSDLPKISSIKTAVVSRDFRPELSVKGAKTTHSTSSYLFVAVTLTDGTQGFGEMSGTRNWSGEDSESARKIIKQTIEPYISGKSPSDVIGITQEIDKKIEGNHFTKASINMALWDAVGKCLEVPVYELLGGKKRDRIPVKISISGDGAEIENGIEAAKQSGFTSFKVKVGHGRLRDLPRFRLARKILGDESFIGVDANCGWSREEAEHCIPNLIADNTDFVEQPVAKEAWSDMRALRRFGKPIIADESVFGLADAATCINEEAADGVSIYVGKSGALENAYEIGELCVKAGKKVIIGSNAELGIGTAAQIQLAAALPELGSIPSDIIGQHFYQSGTLDVENFIDGQFAYVGNAPGLGVSPKSEIMREFI